MNVTRGMMGALFYCPEWGGEGKEEVNGLESLHAEFVCVGGEVVRLKR